MRVHQVVAFAAATSWFSRPLSSERSVRKGLAMTLRAKNYLALVLAACFAILPGLVFAAVLAVDGDGQATPSNCNASNPTYSTIGAAIAAASNGDEIVVCPGTYFETINFGGKAITLRSASGAAATVIDGGLGGPVVTFASGETRQAVLQGFTIRNGRAATFEGGGIQINSASPTIIGNLITGNEACSGGAGVSVAFGSPLIRGNTITQNRQVTGCSSGDGGGGIFVRGAGSAQIIGNTISNNTMASANGGGIRLHAAGTPTIMNNVISGNAAATGFSPCSTGGGIDIANVSDAEIIQNFITGNSAGCGGGIAWLVPSGARGPRLVNNTIADNNATTTNVPTASGIHAEGFQTQVEIVNNIVVAGQTAIYCPGTFGSSTPQFKSNDVFSSGGTRYGGICTDQTGSNGNISADPLFVNAAGGNYHLQVGSPAIDVGDDNAIGAPQLNDNNWALITPLDIDGDPRVMDGNNDGIFRVDMGADEVLGEKPAARCFGSTAVYDPTSSRLIVHSGALCGSSAHASDTWALTDGNGVGGPAHWEKVSASGPTATHNHTAVYDSANNRMVVYGGCSGGCLPTQAGVFVLTNANGLGGTATWSALAAANTPQGRQGHKAFYDPNSNRMIVWGGQDGGGSVASQFREVWTLTNPNGLGGSSAWSLVPTSGGLPEAGYFSAAVYDSANNRLVVFGGIDPSGVESNAVWVLSNANGLGGAAVWTNTVARNAVGSPPPRSGAQAIYNAANNTMTIFDGGPNADVWRLTNANGVVGPSVWSQIAVAGGPGGSRVPYNAGSYDPVTDAMMVFATNAAGNGNEGWVLRPRGTPLDNIAPTTSASVAPAPNGAGWNNTTVNVTLNATDNPGGSGVQSITYNTGGTPVTVTGATASFAVSAAGTTTVTYQATDKAGNTEAPKTLVVKIDIIAPSTTATASPAPNAAGWNNVDVSVGLAATDNAGGSGARAISYVVINGSSSSGTTVNGASAIVAVSMEGVNTVSYHAMDVADNVESPKTLTVRIDRTAPSTIASLAPAPNAAGWNNSSAGVTLTAMDNAGGSGVESVSYSIDGGATTTVPGGAASFSVAMPGVHTVSYQSKDKAGNVESAKTLLVRIDTVAPVTTASASPPPNAAGWNNSNVAVTLSAADNAGGSGVQAVTYSLNGAPATIAAANTTFTVSSEGVNVITYQATDLAGNVEALKTLTVRIDRTPPSATLNLSPGSLWPPNHRLVNITPTLLLAPDASGPVTVSGPVVTSNEPVDGLGDGDTAPDWVVSGGLLQLRAERAGGGAGRVYTVTYTLTDQAGNSSTVSGIVTVPHDRR